MKILLVEDDPFLIELLTQTLTEQTYLVETAIDGQLGWELVEAFQYDLILLDVMLPKLDGIRFCQRLRDRKNITPVILLTSQDSATHKVSGLDAGADDYLVKPFNIDELLARIRALLRRDSTERGSVLEWQGLQLNPNRCAVNYQGQPLTLTSKEYKLLELFLRNPQRIFSQTALISHLWSLEDAPTENGVRAHIKGLRRKLKQAGCEDLIETIYGLGYRLKIHPPQVTEPIASELPPVQASETSVALQQELIQQSNLPIPSELAGAWERYRGQYRDRVTVIQQAMTALAADTLSEPLRQAAQREAHTLAGSLGTFELHELAQTCRDIETVFETLPGTGDLSSTDTTTLLERLAIIENTLMVEVTVSSPTPNLQKTQNHLLLIGNDHALMNDLSHDTIAQFWQITILAPEAAIAAVAQSCPDVVLLDLDNSDHVDRGFEWLAALARLQPVVPVVVLTAQNDFSERVKIARLGGHTVLQKPVALENIRYAIAQALQSSVSLEGKILVVDDDPVILEQLSVILQPWGFQVEGLNHPSTFWQKLEQVKPDLLILDMVMPEFSGLDLCQVVRNDPQWEPLPVLFLSSRIDPDLIYQVFQAGADDYVRKPIIEPELVARIMNQLKRSQPKSA